MCVTRTTTGNVQYWRRKGTGRRLVLLHGIGSHGDSFLTLLPYLPQDWEVIAWTAPGYDGSDDLDCDAPSDSYWPDENVYSDALRWMLKTAGTSRVTVLGHSLGALIGARFAADHPAMVRSLVLADPATGHGQQVGTLSGAAARRIADLEAQGPAAFAAARAPRLLTDPAAHSRALAEVQAQMSRVRPRGYTHAVRMLASGRLEESLRRVTCPAAILWGTGDAITPRAQAECAATALGGATIHDIPGAGHASYVEAPRAFADMLVAALKQTETQETLT